MPNRSQTRPPSPSSPHDGPAARIAALKARRAAIVAEAAAIDAELVALGVPAAPTASPATWASSSAFTPTIPQPIIPPHHSILLNVAQVSAYLGGVSESKVWSMASARNPAPKKSTA